MLVRLTTIIAFLILAGQEASASGLRRLSCTVVRHYVAKYSEAAAESWARGRGATDAEIEAARRCLSGPSNVQSASYAGKR